MVESPTIRVSGSSAFCGMGPCWLEVAVADACTARLRGDWFSLCLHRPSGRISGSGVYGWQACPWTLEVAGTGSSAAGLTSAIG